MWRDKLEFKEKMNNTLSIIFLILFFVLIEIYRLYRGQKGIILSIDAPSEFFTPLSNIKMKVRLANGKEITALASVCLMCTNRLTIGDEVRILKRGEDYIITLSFFASRASNNCKINEHKICS